MTDTTTNCFTTTITEMVPVVYYTYSNPVDDNTNVSPIGGGTVSYHSDGALELDAPATRDGFSYALRGMKATGAQTMQLDVDAISGEFWAIITDDTSSDVVGSLKISGSSVGGAGLYTVNLYAESPNMHVILSYAGGGDPTTGGNVVIKHWGTAHDTLVQTSIVTTVCDKDFYRYGFNGQLKDNEWGGLGNSLEFRHRGYDPRIGRFRSTDPLFKDYPWYAPYQFAGNSVIWAKDLEGLEPAAPWGYFLNAAGVTGGNNAQSAKAWVQNVVVPAVVKDAKIIGGAALMMVPGFEEEGVEVELSEMAAAKTYVSDATEGTAVIRLQKTDATPVEFPKTELDGGESAPVKKADYSNVPDPKNAGSGQRFTPAQKKAAKLENMKQNGGVIKSDKSGKVLNMSKQSKKGVKADMNQAEVDHIIPRSKGGKNTNDNMQIISKEENIKKSDQ
jgi:RHS repeat-associated protein